MHVSLLDDAVPTEEVPCIIPLDEQLTDEDSPATAIDNRAYSLV